MFHHPAWAVGSYRSDHQPGELPKSESTQPRFATRYDALHIGKPSLYQGGLYCIMMSFHFSCRMIISADDTMDEAASGGRDSATKSVVNVVSSIAFYFAPFIYFSF